MPKMRSCGVLLFADVPAGSGSRHFLLMKHNRRYDLPKGHVEAYVLSPASLSLSRFSLWSAV
jgi:hypothetical protein